MTSTNPTEVSLFEYNFEVFYNNIPFQNCPVDKNHIANIYNLCRDLTSDYDKSHDITHHVNVFMNGCEILNDMNIDNSSNQFKKIFKLITYACLLHDTIDHKYPKDVDIKKNKLEKFLSDEVLDLKEEIMWIINNISYSKEVKYGYPKHTNQDIQLARDIVSDADKLESIGVVGLDRCIEFAKSMNTTLSENEIMQSVIQHCHDKLLKIYNFYIRTEPGKKRAVDKHKFIELFVNTYSFSV